MPKLIALLLGSLVTLMISVPATAQEWPKQKPIEFVVPYPPGNPGDPLARAIAQQISDDVGQAVVVIHKPGFSGIIGAEYVARSKPDGYTLLYATVSNVSGLPALKKSLPFDPGNAFAPIAMFGNVPFFIVVNPSLPVKSVADLVAYGKANPGKLNWAFSSHVTNILATEMAKSTGIDVTKVPYRTYSDMVSDLLTNRIDLTYDGLGPWLGSWRDGKVRIIATSATSRVELAPDVPTLAELGFRPSEIQAYLGLMAPAGTPPAITEHIQRSVFKAMKRPDMQPILKNLALDVKPLGPTEFKKVVVDQIDKWKGAAVAAGIIPD